MTKDMSKANIVFNMFLCWTVSWTAYSKFVLLFNISFLYICRNSNNPPIHTGKS